MQLGRELKRVGWLLRRATGDVVIPPDDRDLDIAVSDCTKTELSTALKHSKLGIEQLVWVKQSD